MTKVLANPGGISPAAAAMSVLAACGAFLITPTVASAQSAFTLGGTIIGLRGSGLTLSTNGQNVLPTTFLLLRSPIRRISAAS